MKRKLPRAAVPVLLGVVLLLIALVGWFGVIAPQRSKADNLQKQIDETRSQVLVLTSAQKQKTPRERLVRVADLFRLSKAVPDAVRMPDILLELSHVAGSAGITFDSITPHAPVTMSGYEVVPIDVVFQGNYYTLSDLLYRLRNLVEVHDGRLVSTGRLYDIDRISFKEGDAGFPAIEASLVIDAFVYTGVPLTIPGAPGSTTSTTTGSTSTTPPAEAAAAGGSTS